MKGLALPGLPNMADLSGMMAKIHKSANDTATMVELLTRLVTEAELNNRLLTTSVELLIDIKERGQ